MKQEPLVKKEENGTPTSTDPLYTPAELQFVDWILSVEDYYQVLGLKKQFSDEELRYNYKKV